MTLQQVHGSIVNTTQARGIIHTSPLTVGIGIHPSLVTVWTPDANLTHLDWLPLPLAGSLDIGVRRSEDFDTILTNKAVKGSQPILILVQCQCEWLGKLTEWTLGGLNQFRVDYGHS